MERCLTLVVMSFPTKAASSHEILHRGKKKQFLIFVCTSVLRGDVSFAD